MQPTKSQELQEFLRNLEERKAQIEQESILSIKERLEAVYNKKWVPTENLRRAEFSNRLAEMKKVVLMELAIVESIRSFVPPDVTNLVAKTLVKVRGTDNLRSMNGASHRYRDNVKIRQVIKLVNAVYRYNRNVISGYASGHDLKSRIKHSTTCTHCGETALEILVNMMDSKVIQLPS